MDQHPSDKPQDDQVHIHRPAMSKRAQSTAAARAHTCLRSGTGWLDGEDLASPKLRNP